MNKILEEDIQHIIRHNNLEKFNNKTIFVTGATGFIGSLFIKTILQYNIQKKTNIQILALIRNKQKAETIFAEFISERLTFIQARIEELPDITQDIHYIVHGASITSSFDFVSKPVDTIAITLSGTKNILELACKKQVISFLYLSSMEIYGITEQNKKHVSEKDYGYIDFLQIRSSYSESKRMAECMCVAYAKQYNVPVKIARLTQTIGPGIDYNDTRIAAYFARAVLENKNIVLNTAGETTRNILYISDAVSALIILLLKGKNFEAYNVANSKEHLSVAQTAELIAKKIACNKIKVEYIIKKMPEYETNKKLFLNLDTSKIESLGWSAKLNTEEAYRRMIKGMKE